MLERGLSYIQKLNYLRRLVNKGDDKISSQIFHLFASKDISQLTIVEQCRYLEAVYETDFTSEILSSTVTWKCMKKRILTADKMLDLVQSRKHESLKHLSTLYSELSWLEIWDMALDYGIRGTKPLCAFMVHSPNRFSEIDYTHAVVHPLQQVLLIYNIYV